MLTELFIATCGVMICRVILAALDYVEAYIPTVKILPCGYITL